ncbi:signal recognition particle-docking protein FtsY [Buchnera aphidicola (Formosaphis micheliae)]|uniref:signal recognition particle-docking protein FtsY n=1 Tax=Buchnera aphidicola TaxID=9 RepID=UPI0031CC58AC
MKKNIFFSWFSRIKNKNKKILEDNPKKIISVNNISNEIIKKNNNHKFDKIISNAIDTSIVKDITKNSKNYCKDLSIDNNSNVQKIIHREAKNTLISEIKLHKNTIVSKNRFVLKLREVLKKTRDNFSIGIKSIFLTSYIDSKLFDTIEEMLLLADVGLETTTVIIKHLKSEVLHKKFKTTQEVYNELKRQMLLILSVVVKEKSTNISAGTYPFVILVVGVNGVGKTTNIAKLAVKYKNLGKKVMLVAGDTFRAAAIEQLKLWGSKIHVSVIAQHVNADSAAVVFDAMKSAKAKNIDILIVDTAGRLHNNINLMNELKKIKKVIKKIDVLAPHEIFLVVDSCNGQNTLIQTELFHKLLHLTGIIVTKLDGTAKGGIIFSIVHKFSIPIRYISTGEKINDLRTFDNNDFINSIF